MITKSYGTRITQSPNIVQYMVAAAMASITSETWVVAHQAHASPGRAHSGIMLVQIWGELPADLTLP
jgi:hypothetical protein